MTNGKPMSVSDDQPFREALRHILKENEDRKEFLMGFSLGGSITINMLSDEFDNGQITAALAV